MSLADLRLEGICSTLPFAHTWDGGTKEMKTPFAKIFPQFNPKIDASFAKILMADASYKAAFLAVMI
jgi:hypothetical protein